jgi:hypothetical protein
MSDDCNVDIAMENNDDFEKVGIWKRNRISIVTRKADIPSDFTELVVKFNEK